jgi:hypothetical protein
VRSLGLVAAACEGSCLTQKGVTFIAPAHDDDRSPRIVATPPRRAAKFTQAA